MNIQQYKEKVVKAGLSDEATRVLLGLEFQVHGEEAYIDSLQIADRLDVEHKNLMATIRKFVEDQENLTAKVLAVKIGIIETTYLNSRNQSQPLFLLNERAALRIIMKSNSRNADYFQDIIAEGFLLLRDINETVKKYEVIDNFDDLRTMQKVKIEVEDMIGLYDLFEVPKHIVLHDAVGYIERKYDVDLRNAYNSSACLDKINSTNIFLEVSKIELDQLGWDKKGYAGARLNKVLAFLGYQTKVGNTWKPTEKAGKENGNWKYNQPMGKNSNKLITNIAWRVDFVVTEVNRLLACYSTVDEMISNI